MATAPGVSLSTDVDVAIETLSANTCTLLDVSRCGLGKAGLSKLAGPLVANTSVRALKLEACMITRDSCDVLVDMVLANGRIERLQLSHNHLGAQGASQLQRLLEESSVLTSLDLYDTMLGDSGVDRIASTLADNKFLKSLDLRSGMTKQDISTREMRALSKGRFDEATAPTSSSVWIDKGNAATASVDSDTGDGGGVRSPVSFRMREIERLANESPVARMRAVSPPPARAVVEVDAQPRNDAAAERLEEADGGKEADSDDGELERKASGAGAHDTANAQPSPGPDRSRDDGTPPDADEAKDGGEHGADVSASAALHRKAASRATRAVRDVTSRAVSGASNVYIQTMGRGPSRRMLLNMPKPITAMGAAALYRCLRVNKSLQHLELGYNCLGDAGTASLSKALGTSYGAHCALQSLSLAYNGISGAGAVALAEALATNTQLASLNLSGNDIGCRGAAQILAASKATATLRVLNLTACGFVEEESEGVCDCLDDHPSLQDLTLDQNDIGDLGALALSNALVSNKVLISLSLVHCHVCEGGARRILYSLETKNKTLRALDMSDNQMSQALYSSIHAVVRKRGGAASCSIL